MSVRVRRTGDAAIADVPVTRGHATLAETKKNEGVVKRHDASFEAHAPGPLHALLGILPPTSQRAAASQEATRALDAAKSDGLTGSELRAAEARVAAKYGPTLGKQVLLEALGMRGGQLTLEAVGYLQGQYGNMQGHIGRYQEVLATHLGDAKLLDSNLNGKLDASDLVFTTNASGRIDTREVGAALADKVKIGAAIVGACEAMSEARHDFALTRDQKMSSHFWEPVGSGTFYLNPDVRPSDAMADIFARPGEYQFECGTALVIVYYKAMLDLIGPKDFDEACKDLQIGPWKYESSLRQHLQFSGDGAIEASEQRKGELTAGDYTYFKNWDVSPQSRTAGWQGENVIFLGNGKYYGHPFGVETGKHIVDFLNENRTAGSTRSASMVERQGRLDPLVLVLDRQDG